MHSKSKFLLYCSCTICKTQVTVQTLSSHFNSHIKNYKQCPKCNTYHYKQGTFCSRSCANSKAQKDESNDKRRNSLVGKSFKPKYTKVACCKICNKWFLGRRLTCSDACKSEAFRIGGKNSAALIIKRSQDEIRLFNLCNSYFDSVDHNIPIFDGWDADIIIHDIKTAILWNGPWHYKEMAFNNHSLSQVKTRDRIKISIIISLGWNVIVFEDSVYTPESAFDILKILNG